MPLTLAPCPGYLTDNNWLQKSGLSGQQARTRVSFALGTMKKHAKGIGCDPFYSAIREQRKCSCGREGIGLDKNGIPVCQQHDRFPTNRVRNFPPIPSCPGPHSE